MNLKKIALVSIAVAAAAAGPALANCVDPAPTFGQLFAGSVFCPSEPTGLCAVIVPAAAGAPSARFWGQTQGNFSVDNTSPSCPTATCGADNGNYSPYDANVPWILQADEGSGPVPGKYWIGSDWNAGGDTTALAQIDGCPSFPVAGQGSVMLIGLSASDAAGNGYFAIAWEKNFAGAKGDYEFSTVNKTASPNSNGTGAGNIVLRQVPKAFITASSRLSSTSHSFSIRSLTLAQISNGLYGDNSMTDAQAVQGFKIYQRIVPRGSAIPANTRSAWTAASGTLAFGAPDTPITVNCATNSDVYFAYSIVGDSGFETAQVGSSRAGQCGPTLADPGKGKVIPRGGNKGGTVNPNN